MGNEAAGANKTAVTAEGQLVGLPYTSDNVDLLAREMFARDYQFNRSTDLRVPSLAELRAAWESEAHRIDRHLYRSRARRALTSIEAIVNGEMLIPDGDDAA